MQCHIRAPLERTGKARPIPKLLRQPDTLVKHGARLYMLALKEQCAPQRTEHLSEIRWIVQLTVDCGALLKWRTGGEVVPMLPGHKSGNTECLRALCRGQRCSGFGEEHGRPLVPFPVIALVKPECFERSNESQPVTGCAVRYGERKGRTHVTLLLAQLGEPIASL